MTRRRAWLTGTVASVAVLAAAAVLLAVRPWSGNHAHAAARSAHVSSTLVGPKWTLVSYITPDGATHPANTYDTGSVSIPTLQIDDKHTAQGADGCNGWSGTAGITTTTINVKEQVGSAAGETAVCGIVESVLEGPNGTANGTAATWSIADNTLTVTRVGYGSLVYGLPGPSLELIGQKWVLASYTTAARVTQQVQQRAYADHRSAPYLEIDAADDLQAWDGCNTTQAQATISGDRVSIGAGGTTTALCLDAPASKTFDAVLLGQGTAAAGHTTSWSIIGEQLRLSRLGAGALTFELPQPSAAGGSSSASGWTMAMPFAPDGLTGVTWELKSLVRYGTATSEQRINARPWTLTFADDGSVSDPDPCSGFNAQAAIGDGTILVEQLSYSTDLCLDADPTKTVIAKGARLTWKIDSGQLTVTNGGTSLVYSQATVSTGTPSPSAT